MRLSSRSGGPIAVRSISGKGSFQEALRGFLAPKDQYPIFNIQSFKSGIYFVELNNGKEKAVKKFLKE